MGQIDPYKLAMILIIVGALATVEALAWWATFYGGVAPGDPYEGNLLGSVGCLFVTSTNCRVFSEIVQLGGQTALKLAEKLTNIPLTQLMCMKLIVNQAYENMGLQSTQTLGPILDGIMRNTPEGREFVNVSESEGVATAIQRRDGPFGDYSQGPIEQRPRKRSELKM